METSSRTSIPYAHDVTRFYTRTSNLHDGNHTDLCGPGDTEAVKATHSGGRREPGKEVNASVNVVYFHTSPFTAAVECEIAN